MHLFPAAHNHGGTQVTWGQQQGGDHSGVGSFLELQTIHRFWNRQDLLLIMGTEILKIDAEMAEKIEVEVGNPHLESDRQSEN